MKTPIPGLRVITYDARSAAKVQISIAPGETLAVSDSVAEQLRGESAQFREITEQPAPAPAPAPKKAAAKKTAVKK